MRKALSFAMVAAIVCAGLAAWTVVAQTNDAATAEKVKKPKVYILIKPADIEQFPERFEGSYVRMPDFFGERVERRDFPRDRELRRNNITPESHFAFTTNRVSGSNMLCFVPRDNKEAQGFFDAPLVPDMKIYLVGGVGRRIGTNWGRTTIFMVERIVRGHVPPTLIKKKEKTEVIVKIEYEVDTPQGIVIREHQTYRIPKPGRYEIIDPYSRRKLYMTFKF